MASEAGTGWAGAVPATRVAGGCGSGRPGATAIRLGLGALGFVGLTAGMLWYQLSTIPAGGTLPAWTDVRWTYLPAILLLLPAETLAAALRTWLLCRTLRSPVGYLASVEAELANVGLAMLTPSQSGGGAGQVYILSRAGLPVGAATAVALVSFAGTMVGLLGLGLYALGRPGTGTTGPLFAGAAWTVSGVAVAMLAGAACPGPLRSGLTAGAGAIDGLLARFPDRRRAEAAGRAGARWAGALATRLADLVEAYADAVRRVIRHGRVTFVLVCLLSVAFLLVRAVLPILCLRFLGLSSGTLRRILDAQLGLIFLLFFAPTPGGAGVAEGASQVALAAIVPPGFAPLYHLLWRFTTAYLAALAGLACLAHAVVRDARCRYPGRSRSVHPRPGGRAQP